MLKEFKEFAVKGNVIDLAIGVVIGAAFGKVVSSFVADLLTPPIGFVLGKVDFSSLFVSLLPNSHPESLADAKAAGVPTLNYGLFINAVLDFLIVAFAVYLLAKVFNRVKKGDALAKKETCPKCLSSIPQGATRCAFCTSDLAFDREKPVDRFQDPTLGF